MRRGRGGEGGEDRLVELAPEGDEGAVRLGVARADAGDLLAGAIDILVKAERRAVREGRECEGIGILIAQAVAGEAEFLDDAGEMDEDMERGAGIDAVAGPERLGIDRAADHRAAFEDANRMPGAGEIGGGDEAVVPRADDDDRMIHRGLSRQVGKSATTILSSNAQHAFTYTMIYSRACSYLVRLASGITSPSRIAMRTAGNYRYQSSTMGPSTVQTYVLHASHEPGVSGGSSGIV